LPDHSWLANGKTLANETYVLTARLSAAPLTSIRLEVLPDPSLPNGGAGRAADGNFVLSHFGVETASAEDAARSVKLSGAWADFAQTDFAVADAINVTELTKKGWAVAPRQNEPHEAVFFIQQPLTALDNKELIVRLEHRFKDPGYCLGRFRISVTSAPNISRRTGVPAALLAIVDTARAQRTAEQNEKLARYYRSIAPALQPVRDEIARLEKARPAIATVPIMEELPPEKRRETHVLVKSNFLTPGERVEPGVPASLHPWPDAAQKNRLGLAQWIADARNPLTARVAVNRLWAQIFGVGIVETEEDFGTQGEPPSHPELLDWLALEYMRLGWDTKALLRLMVTSSTYRQSSRLTPELLAKDPHNRLLARAPRFRLEAEMVRDQALALSGLLSRKLGGPSVYPPQPDGLWQAAFNGQRTWSTSKGEERYRRALYTFWRRTVPYPSMATFDAPSREICSVRRVRTNTPLQAFVTLNDPAYVEASQALARRIVREGGTTPEERARFALRVCLCRPADQAQVQQLLGLYAAERFHYDSDLKAATALATDPLGPLSAGMAPGELAAWTTVANVLLNLDGVLTRR
jgi:hypothetical protein